MTDHDTPNEPYYHAIMDVQTETLQMHTTLQYRYACIALLLLVQFISP